MKKEIVDKKAREAIMQIANLLCDSMFSTIFVKKLADYLFIADKKKKRAKRRVEL